MSVLGRRLLFAILPFVILSAPSVAAQQAPLGARISLAWGLPFVGVLLSVVLVPLLAPHFWRDHLGKLAAFWATLFLLPFALAHGAGVAVDAVLGVYVARFIPLIVVLWSAYVIAGGVRLRGRLRGTPVVNTCILALGALLASWIGPAAASLLLIGPLIRANAWRQKKAHLVVFLIFLVANIGGSLTPLGDRALSVGYERGVPFDWASGAMLAPMLACVGALLVLFFVIDRTLLRRETTRRAPDDGSEQRLGLEGGLNLLLLGGIVVAVLYSGLESRGELYWDQARFDRGRGVVTVAETDLTSALLQVRAAAAEDRAGRVDALLVARATVHGLRAAAFRDAVKGWRLTDRVIWPFIDIVRDGCILLMGVLSLLLGARSRKRTGGITWAPLLEAGKLFGAIFVTLAPVIAILQAGALGELGWLAKAVTGPDGRPVDGVCFWLVGALSSVMDSTPVYLAFVDMAGAGPSALAVEFPKALMAISAGAVFMGGLTYIGSAHNLVLRSMAVEAGISMPSFLGYLLKWSLPILAPIFWVVSLIWF